MIQIIRYKEDNGEEKNKKSERAKWKQVIKWHTKIQPYEHSHIILLL